MKKRLHTRFTLLVALLLVLAGCGSKGMEMANGKVNVVASFYPVYDFAKKIGGDHVNVINVVPAGAEPHDWSPKGRDISSMSKADLLVYQGAGFEGWTEDFLKSLPSGSKLRAVETSKGLDLLRGHEEEASGHGAKASADQHPEEYDPHTWLSPRLAKQMAGKIKDAIISADAAHKADYEANYAKLAEQFDKLDGKYKDSLSKTAKKSIVVSHDAFAYLCRDYGLEQKAIMGLSPDAEPTGQKMKEVNQFVKDNQVKYIFFEELVSDKLAKTLAKDAGIETLVLNPLEGLTENESKAGADYFSVMESNLQKLLKALQ